jgi:hypothetical protein
MSQIQFALAESPDFVDPWLCLDRGELTLGLLLAVTRLQLGECLPRPGCVCGRLLSRWLDQTSGPRIPFPEADQRDGSFHDCNERLEPSNAYE